MTKFTVPIKFTSIGSLGVNAPDYKSAVAHVERLLIEKYQAGNPTTSKDINWLGAEAEVDGDEIDLDKDIG